MQIKSFILFLFISICTAQIQVQSLGRSGLENALLMERKGDLQEAQKIYELILETKPKNRQAYNRLKNIYNKTVHAVRIVLRLRVESTLLKTIQMMETVFIAFSTIP